MIPDAMEEATSWIYLAKLPGDPIYCNRLSNEAELACMHRLRHRCKECVNVPWKDRMMLEVVFQIYFQGRFQEMFKISNGN